MKVVEKIGRKARQRSDCPGDLSGLGWSVRRSLTRLLYRKLRYDLLLALVKYLEVILAKVSHRLPLRISYHHMHRHKLYIHLKRGSRIRR
jgi:hypothetical protein